MIERTQIPLTRCCDVTKRISAVPEKLRRNDLRVLDKTRTHSTHAFVFGGKIIACPMDWQATGGKKLLTNYNAFSCPVYSAFFSSLKYNEHAVKGKKKHLVHRGGKRFDVIM